MQIWHLVFLKYNYTKIQLYYNVLKYNLSEYKFQYLQIRNNTLRKIATIHFFLHVPLHVQSQVIGPGEGPLAEVALERPVSSVLSVMTGELVGPCEFPPTSFPTAVIRFFTCRNKRTCSWVSGHFNVNSDASGHFDTWISIVMYMTQLACVCLCRWTETHLYVFVNELSDGSSLCTFSHSQDIHSCASPCASSPKICDLALASCLRQWRIPEVVRMVASTPVLAYPGDGRAFPWTYRMVLRGTAAPQGAEHTVAGMAQVPCIAVSASSESVR